MDSILKTLADNPALFEAVKKAVKDKFLIDALSTEYPNELLGEIVRARIDGMQRVDEAFSDIARLKSSPAKPPQINQAR